MIFHENNNQTVKLLSIWLINWISSVYNHEHVEYSNISFYSTTVNMLTISQHQLSLSSWTCQLFSSISFFSHVQFSWFNFFWFKFSHSFLCYFFIWLILLLCLRFWSDLLLQTIILSCVIFLLRNFLFILFFIIFYLLVWDFSQILCYELLFDLMQHFQTRFLFVFSNFRSTNFFNVCIQCVRVNLVNLIDKDLISSVNQIQLEVSNQF